MAKKEGDWGGPWTEKKLEAFSKYVWSYLAILKRQTQWETIYFDGFAGSGERRNPTPESEALSLPPLICSGTNSVNLAHKLL